MLQPRLPSFNGFANSSPVVAREIVRDHGISRTQGRHQALLHIGEKPFAVHRPVKDRRSRDPCRSQCTDEGRGLPAAVQNLRDDTLTTKGSDARAGRIRVGSRLIEI